VSAQVELISGEAKETEYVYFFDFRAGKIAEVNEFFDTVYVGEISS
jgi:ketosteroid isomerase-like protein